MRTGRLFMVLLLSCIVSMYFFPIGFRFLPSSLNTKQILGVVGILAFVLRCLRERQVRMSRMVVASALWAVVFSVWCYFSMLANDTDDTTYAEYYISFAVWLGGAYGVCSLLRHYHGYCDMRLLTEYLALVCVEQCFLALAIDDIPAFQMLVDRFVVQGQEYMRSVNRLYGIGAALDPAGIKFSAVLVLMAHQIAVNKDITDNRRTLCLYIVAFLVITIVGNMISRTTLVGVGMGMIYVFLFVGLSRKGVLSARQMRFYSVALALLAVGVALCVVLYRTNMEFRSNLRFAFEGFFNYFEHGEFRTDSTDKLNSVMWKWPSDFRTWVIGSGLFGNFVFSTDIGYCRFTLYCGLIGLAIFSGFFIYNGLVINRKFRDVTFLSLMLVSLTFVIWLKVATDIFLINALLFCVDGDFEEDMPPEENAGEMSDSE